ncbi:MAG: DUF4058 family protein [Isosphaeraceae bacterium]
MIFPGMDPYLEDPVLWPGVHSSLIVYMRDLLQPRLRPRYVAAIEERVYVQGPDRDVMPDVSIRQYRPERAGPVGGAALLEADAPVVVKVPPEPVRETYDSILDLHANPRVVTLIEVVSPSNKCPGPGRESYLAKQGEVFAGGVHLVEIDLLRRGTHVLSVPEYAARRNAPYDTLACVNRAEGRRDSYELYPRPLADRLPRIRIPLAGDDPDVPLDAQAILNQTYEAGSYRDRIDYSRPCHPPLTPDQQAWAAPLLRAG